METQTIIVHKGIEVHIKDGACLTIGKEGGRGQVVVTPKWLEELDQRVSTVSALTKEEIILLRHGLWAIIKRNRAAGKSDVLGESAEVFELYHKLEKYL